MVCPVGQIRFYTYNTVGFLLVGAYVIVLIYIRGDGLNIRYRCIGKKKIGAEFMTLVSAGGLV